MIVAGLVAFLVYPGGLLAIGLCMSYRLLSNRLLPFQDILRFSPGLIGSLVWASLVLVAGGLACLPWPWHPWPIPFGWLGAWVLLEFAAWLPFLPALLAGAPHLVRAAVREAQISMLGRTILWGAVATGLAIADAVSGWSGIGHGLILLSTLLSLPAAINWGPFGPEPSLGPQGITTGLATRLAWELTFARDTVAAALIAAGWLGSLPLALLPPWLGLLAIVGGSAGTALVLRWLQGRVPRLSVPSALRTTLLGAGSLAILALIVSVLGQR
jgi:hypothetical protein